MKWRPHCIGRITIGGRPGGRGGVGAVPVRPGNRSLLFKLVHGVLSHTKKNTSLVFVHFKNSDCQAEYGGAFITVSPEFRKLR